MTVISKKQIRDILNYSSRRVFNDHLKKTGITQKLPAFYFSQKVFFGEQVVVLEGIFQKKFTN
jgi:hypothetical protein